MSARATVLLLVAARLVAAEPTALAQVAPSPEAEIPVWRNGRIDGATRARDAAGRRLLVLDLGDAWTPRLFAGGPDRAGRPRASSYGPTFVALAREQFEADTSGRARRDRYLEPYGIPPALSVLRRRLTESLARPCAARLDFGVLRAFSGLPLDEGEVRHTESSDVPERFLQSLLLRQAAFGPARVGLADLPPIDRRLLALHHRWSRTHSAVAAVQSRLVCDGHLRTRFVPASFDDPTRNALAEMERRHRIYALGRLTGPTLEALRTPPAELERRAVVRVLTERAMSAAGIIEDATVTTTLDGWPRTYWDAFGDAAPMRDLEREMSERVVASFGLETPGSAARWLDSLGDLATDGPRWVAIEALELPPYYAPEMDLFVVIDRGDVSYDPPFDAQGRLVAPALERRPTLSLHVRWLGQEILLARYPTTIGGWRIESSADGERWRYYESPSGPAVWERIVSAPVWLPPPATPARDLVTQYRVDETTGTPVREVRRYLLGPGYASAYGLVAAYHRSATRRPDGTLVAGADRGVRTHGSVDYTSIWQRASHGCHRLHNHLAIRLFETVLARRPHRRVGESPLSFRTNVDVDGVDTELRVTRSGYVFELDRPLEINVLPGRVRGTLRSAPAETVPVLTEPSG
ncbi:MAG: hypothetical protein IT379_04560 [Deltaproteobacteria bacterium]|nr:hypothetical protein [Deltaproteobacteria bacterium]